MKAIKLIMIAALATFAFCSAAKANDQKPSKNSQTIVYYVDDMKCDNCKARIEKTVPYEKGVKDVSVDVVNKTVTVNYDPRKNNAEAIRNVIRNLDMNCEVMPENDMNAWYWQQLR